MRTYGQYCPVSRASEVLGERWTMIIVRNLLLGAATFNAIADGAPEMSRSLLSKRLDELERAGIITVTAKTEGRGSHYELTEAGTEPRELIDTMGGPPHSRPSLRGPTGMLPCYDCQTDEELGARSRNPAPNRPLPVSRGTGPGGTRSS